VKFLDAAAGRTHVGLAHGPGVLDFVGTNPGLVDYVEIPFEQLRHAPGLASIQEDVPLVLHCASMSVAGFVPSTDATLDAISEHAERTRSPWIGEHLAFITADPLETGVDVAGSPTALTYTVCPQLSEDTVERVADNLAALRRRVRAPLILENSPQYFAIPGSTMSMVEFVGAVLSRCDVGLLLDLTHFAITMLNTGEDALEQIGRLPLERVVEIHVSGLNVQSGIAWDDHATPAPPLVFALLDRALERARPRAVTLEYNWSPSFPRGVLHAHLERVHRALARP
jgi:uncharacterized protein (UPF0276 family)